MGGRNFFTVFIAVFFVGMLFMSPVATAQSEEKTEAGAQSEKKPVIIDGDKINIPMHTEWFMAMETLLLPTAT